METIMQYLGNMFKKLKNSKMKYMFVDGKYFALHGLYQGYVYLGNPLDVNNNTTKSGVVWEISDVFKWAHETPRIIELYFNIRRFFMTDVFGQNDFKTVLKHLTVI